jgi:hypothetical protein
MADQKIAYASSASVGITLASLASDTNSLAGRESDVISNASNLYVDYLLSGVITTASSGLSNGKSILVYVYAQQTDSPTYPAGITGSDAALTVTSDEVRDAGLLLAACMSTNNTGSTAYSFSSVSVASCFGGSIPQRWGCWVTHDTGAALASGTLTYQGIYGTVS